LAKHKHAKVKKVGPKTWAIQANTGNGYRTIGKSDSRMRANMSAGIASSNIDQGKAP
jgi:hypothetical protein